MKEEFFPQENEEKRNLKSWAVKLPNDVIEEIEKLHKASGLRFKNEFIEHLLKQYKVNLFKEGEPTDELLHPEVIKNSESDIHEFGKLTQLMNELFVNRLEKESVSQYELERLKKDYQELLKKYQALKDSVSDENGDVVPMSYLEEHIRKEIRNGFGHRLFIGISGSGKTIAAKCEIKKAIEQNRQVVVFDSTGDYNQFVESYNGITYNINSEKGVQINPFEFLPIQSTKTGYVPTLIEKIHDNCNFIELLLHRQLKSHERKLVFSCLESLYESYVFSKNTTINNDQTPTLADFEKELRRSNEGSLIADELSLYTNNIYPYFNGKRNFHIYESPIISFNISENERNKLYSSSYLTLSFIYEMIKQGIYQNTLLVIDQMWIFSQTSQLRGLISKITKEARKFGVELLLIIERIQVLTDLKELLINIPTTVLFRQTPCNSDFLMNSYLLTNEELNMLYNLNVREALVVGKLKFLITFDKISDEEKHTRNILY